MAESSITCPHCHRSFELTAAMSSAIEAKLREQIDADANRRTAELDAREKAIAVKSAATEKARASIEEEITKRLANDRPAIVAAEAKKARDSVADEITKVQQEKTATEQLLKQREAKLAEAQKNELELRRERQSLQEEKERFELDKQRAIDAERVKIREAAVKDADEQARLKVAEKDKTITDLQVKLQDALRKAEQGSQQLQGEVLELELEALLRSNFPRDTIEPIPKGAFGGDVLHRVIGPLAQPCGTILWESKRTKNWSDGWLAKLREDQRAAKAEAAIIITQTVPKGVEAFDLIEGVWVADQRYAIPVGMAVRHLLVEVASARQAGEGQQTKTELVYQYLTGPRFRLRVQAIVEAFSTMQEDLDKERKAIMKQWDKRREQLDRVMQATVGMYGDLQGIAGKSLQEIEGLDVGLIGAGSAPTPPQLT